MLKQDNLMGFQNENWRHLQIFYISILCEAVQVCSDFSFGQEAALLGITLLEAPPVPDSKLALLESPEMVPSKSGQVNLGTGCSPQGRGHPSRCIHRMPRGSPWVLEVRLPWGAVLGNPFWLHCVVLTALLSAFSL